MQDIHAWGLNIDPVTLLVVVFYIGILMRLLVRAGTAYRSQVNIYPTRRSFIKKNWDIFAARTFITTLLFAWWLSDPSAWARFSVKLGVAPGIGNWIVFPPTPLTSPVFGYIGDVALDQIQMRLAMKFPWLPDIIKGEIPKYDSAVVDVKGLSEDREVGEPGKRKG